MVPLVKSEKSNASEIAQKASFEIIRYAQVWEDSEILLQALKEKKRVLSIASAGDNLLALLSQEREQVVALDLNRTQLFLVELKVAAFKALEYQELLAFLGVHDTDDRLKTLQKLSLSKEAQSYWSSHTQEIAKGVIHIGKFERYFQLFSKRVLPLIHTKKRVAKLIEPKTAQERRDFYNKEWNNFRWRVLFKLFFSRTFMGFKGRDRAFFDHVDTDVSSTILAHTKYALTELDPSTNSYLHYILYSNYKERLPLYLQKENFLQIKNNLHKLEWHHLSIEEYLQQHKTAKFDGFNLSDIFEYMSEEAYKTLLYALINSAEKEARLVYWNMMVTRKSDKEFQTLLQPLTELAQQLHKRDKTFFYKDFIIESVR